MNFRIRKGTHVSHFHEKCPLWPTENYYEQEKPLWWGNVCEECSQLADIDATKREKDKDKKQPESDPDSQSKEMGTDPIFRRSANSGSGS